MKRPIALCLFAVLGVSACRFNIDFLGESELQEVTLLQSPARDKVLLLDVEGTISSVMSASSPLSRERDAVSAVYARLRKAARDTRVKAVLLRLNTPGGEVTASDVIYHEILRFKEETGLPVIGLMADVAASGGYYIAMAADRVMALPTTLTGSIGVISIFPNVRELMDKIGVRVQIVKSGDLKDAGAPFRDMTDEERRLFQDIIDQYYESFLEVIARNRTALSPGELRRLADGRVWTAEQALSLGLIDEIGYIETAFAAAREMAGLREADLVRYTYYPKTRSNLYAAAAGGPILTERKTLEILAGTLKTGFYYLWLPELER